MRTVGFRIGIVFLAATLAACDRMADRSPTQTGPRQAPSGQRHLARGVPIPPGQAVDALPEPYDPARDGAPGKNPILPDPAFNPHRPQPRSIPSRKDLGGAADVTPGNGDRGWFMYFSYQSSGGVYVANDAQTNLVIPDAAVNAASGQGVILYAPTHLAPGGSCLETTTRHQKFSAGAATQHHHGFWDWCTNRGNTAPNSNGTSWYSAPEDMTSATWQNYYVRYNSSTGDYEYITQVYSDRPSSPQGSCWTGLIYNYQLARWDQKARSCGNTLIPYWGTTGWTMWESYNWMASGCLSIPGIKAWSILTQGQDNSWYGLTLGPVGTLDSGSTCFSNGQYTFESPVSGLGSNAWYAHTPGI
jgi:hypothetical protein